MQIPEFVKLVLPCALRKLDVHIVLWLIGMNGHVKAPQLVASIIMAPVILGSCTA